MDHQNTKLSKSQELPKAYEAKQVDSKWYQFWEHGHFFEANPRSSKPKYCIVIPPPNVTGVLHMGHALVNTLQDILVRWKRMCGFETLWVPGTDHAGIATQTVVERHLIKTTKKKRKDFSREEFLHHVWEWKEQNEHSIINQLKRLGCSCDWRYQRFTMDEGNNRAVRAMFKKMYEDGLIYRGDYLVNWDPVTQTAIADDEVEYEERQSFLWHFKYPLKDDSGFITIATTRPETMLGDTAIAVSPRDPRYTHLIGKVVIQPMSLREIPIIADHHIEPEFGTGMVKITPAHDHDDYEIGLRHHLPFINIMTPDAKINDNGGIFEGLSFAEARDAIVGKMQAKGLLVKIEPHVNRVGLSYRSKAVVEPYMSKQWFVRMDRFAPLLKEAVSGGKVALIPKNWESVYFHWIDNLRDWCISRQLWWGHRIPIWYSKENPETMICYEGLDIPEEVRASPEKWVQDEDVLDTWFSAALWPFATLGWPDHTPELQAFYPNAVLVTGHDILFFWVARMILMGEYALDRVPFPETFLHGLIYGKSYWRDMEGGGISYVNEKERLEYDLGKPQPQDVHSKWEKMSKSKGNIIDPLEIIEQYGTDAMRLALCASATQARQIDLDRRRFEEFKNFANKIWNGARFVLMNLDGDESQNLPPLTSEQFSHGLQENLLALEDRWIFSVLNRTIRDVNAKFASYTFDQAALEAYDFFWKEFCAYYLEIAKPILFGKVGSPAERQNKQKILAIVLCQAIRLLHPIAPFITEELFQILKTRFTEFSIVSGVDPYTAEAIKALTAPACIVATYPQVIREHDINASIDQTFDLVGRIVYAIRNIRGEMKLPPGSVTDVYIIGNESDIQFQIAKTSCTIISALVRIGNLEVREEEPKIGFASTGIVECLKIVIPLPKEMLNHEKNRLLKEQDRLAKSIEKMREQLKNGDFVSKAPPQLIEKNKLSLSLMEAEFQAIADKLEALAL